MKASKELVKRAAELGILRSMPDFLEAPLKPGRLKRKFLEIEMVVDSELRKIYSNDANFYTDNKDELSVILEKIGKIFTSIKKDSSHYLHIASVVSFCLAFLEDSESIYPEKLTDALIDILEYYERGNNVEYSDFCTAEIFRTEWEKI